MAYFVSDEFPEADLLKIMKMCLIHDLGEAFTGDILSFDKTEADSKTEELALRQWVQTFPSPEREEWLALYEEMEAQQTQEARIYKALDKLEAVIQHDESDISTWLPLEYDLQLEYGRENVQFSPYLQQLKMEIDDVTRKKIAAHRSKEN